jgi:formate dehydrogenase iron-sulfur subunit
MALQSLDIKRRSATTTPSPEVRLAPEIAKLIDVSACIGCKACQSACMEWNDLRPEIGHTAGIYDNPADLTADAWTVVRFAEVERSGKLEWLIRKTSCMHCSDPGCLKSCPSPGAIVQYKNGIVDFRQENCIGCGYCVTGCPFHVPRVSAKDDKAYKCTLCSDRVAVNLAPACAKTCPTGAIRFGAKEDLKVYAAERIAELKARGFDQAGLYDPPGVGGTHVMFVLHHADAPGLYGLPENPSIDPLVSLWKGVAKPLATAAMAAVALGSLFHYVTKGPNDISRQIEEEIEREDKEKAT